MCKSGACGYFGSGERDKKTRVKGNANGQKFKKCETIPDGRPGTHCHRKTEKNGFIY